MCTNPEGFGDDSNSEAYSVENIMKRLKSPSLDRETICLTGGEPTAHPYFFDLMENLRERFPENSLIIATNGRMFSYMPFLKKFMRFDPIKIEIPLHGSTAQLHDAITRSPGSFDQALAGIKNFLKIKEPHQELELRIIITKINLFDIGNILELIIKEISETDRVVLIFPEFEGMCGKNKETVGITYSEVREKIEDLVGEWAEKISDLRLYHFPLCTLPVSLWKHTWRTLRGEEVTFVEKCADCSYKKYCLGVHKDYLNEIGGEEFYPPLKDILIKEEEAAKMGYHPIMEASEK